MKSHYVEGLGPTSHFTITAVIAIVKNYLVQKNSVKDNCSKALVYFQKMTSFNPVLIFLHIGRMHSC